MSDAFDVSSSGLFGINWRTTVADDKQKVCDLQGCQVQSLAKLGKMHRLDFVAYYLQNGFRPFRNIWLHWKTTQSPKNCVVLLTHRKLHQQRMQCNDAPTLANWLLDWQVTSRTCNTEMTACIKNSQDHHLNAAQTTFEESGATLTTLVIFIVPVAVGLVVADWRGRRCDIVSFYHRGLGRPQLRP